MIKIKKGSLLFFTILFTVSAVFTSSANTKTWENIQGNNKQSILLEKDELSSRDIYQRYGRGEIFSTAILEITNGQDGNIYISIETFAHRGVDRIRHAVTLEQWNEKAQDWERVGFWDFTRTKEEEGGNGLLLFSSDLTLTSYPVNHYYRAIGMHLVELNGEIETSATETHGVYITKN